MAEERDREHNDRPLSDAVKGEKAADPLRPTPTDKDGITPTKVDTKLEDLRYTVGGRSGLGGQVRSGRVTPAGTIQLPAIGSVPAEDRRKLDHLQPID